DPTYNPTSSAVSLSTTDSSVGRPPASATRPPSQTANTAPAKPITSIVWSLRKRGSSRGCTNAPATAASTAPGTTSAALDGHLNGARDQTMVSNCTCEPSTAILNGHHSNTTTAQTHSSTTAVS